MTPTAMADPLAERGPAHASPARRLFEPGGSTLEDLILELWERIEAGEEGDCPVCGGSIAVVGGCSRCGSELS